MRTSTWSASSIVAPVSWRAAALLGRQHVGHRQAGVVDGAPSGSSPAVISVSSRALSSCHNVARTVDAVRPRLHDLDANLGRAAVRRAQEVRRRRPGRAVGRRLDRAPLATHRDQVAAVGLPPIAQPGSSSTS